MIIPDFISKNISSLGHSSSTLKVSSDGTNKILSRILSNGLVLALVVIGRN
jgi:hypothetical protein